MEIESRLLPCGLHVVGQPPTAAEAIATLVNIAEIDRVDNDPPDCRAARHPGAHNSAQRGGDLPQQQQGAPPCLIQHAGASCRAPAAAPADACCAHLLRQRLRAMLYYQCALQSELQVKQKRFSNNA